MFTTRRGLLAPQNTFLDAIIRKCDGPNSCFLLANARILDYPIVYVSNGFINLMGFGRVEIMQKPGLCPFLYGPQTNKECLVTIEAAYKAQKPEQTEIILYKKNLTPLCILVRVFPIKNDEDNVVLFLITFRDLTAFRQPLKEEFLQNSALGAFAAASDAGSSWGRFARLVFSMVRQKSENNNQENMSSASNTNPNETQETNIVKLCEVIKPVNKEENFEIQKTNDQIINTENEIKTIRKEKTKIIIKSGKLYDHSEKKHIKSNELIELSRLEDGDFNLQNLELKPKRNIYNLWKNRDKSVLIKSNSKSNSLNQSTSGCKKFGSLKNLNINCEIEDSYSGQLSVAETIPRYRPEPPCPPKHVLLHYSVFRIVWDWAILFLTGYTALIVPLRVAVIPRPSWIPSSVGLELQHTNSNEWIQPTILEVLTIIDAIIDIIFGVDIVLNFHTSFVGAGGEVVADPPVIRMNYLSGWFTLDLLACLPYEILKYCWPMDNQDIYYLMDALRIIRLLRIGRAARRIDQYLEYVSTLLLLMILCFFLLAHWFACAWYAVGVFDLENRIYYGWIPRIYNDSLRPQQWDKFFINVHTNYEQNNFSTSNHIHVNEKQFNTVTNNSIKFPNFTNCFLNKTCSFYTTQSDMLKSNFTVNSINFPLQNYRDKWSAYLTALYFSLSLLTTIGFGNVAAFTEGEKLLSICCMLIGALVYATIFGNVTTIVQQMYATRTRYNEMMKGVRDFLKIHEVPQELGERVIDYITSSWSVTKGIDTVKVLNYCPKDMQADISVHLNRCVFNSHAAFRLASDGCRRSLAVNFQTLHTAPGDLICHQGESVDQLCFIASGTLEVIQDDEVIAILGKGDVFGDPSWKNTVSVPSAASVRALTYCTLHTIRLDRLRSVLNFYHAFANSFTRNLELTYNLCNRVIFRKLSDVKREMELSMRRNKDPPLSSLPAGHPVRKLISRLRRSSQTGDLSSKQCLSTIMSCHTSLDGSDLENSSMSELVANSNPDGRFSENPPSKTQNQSGDLESTTILVPSQMSTSPIKQNKSDIYPQSNEITEQEEPKPIPPIGLGRGMVLSSNPARKWARLISKVSQPTLQNLNEEPNEDASRRPSIKPKSKPNSIDDQDTKQSITNQIIKNQSIPDIVTNETNINHKINDFQTLDLNIQKSLQTMQSQLTQEIGRIIHRLDNLENQIKDIKQILPVQIKNSENYSNVISNDNNNNNNSPLVKSNDFHSIFRTKMS